MLHTGCGCVYHGVFHHEDPRYVAVLRKYGYRCISCRTAKSVTVHSLLPVASSEVELELCIVVCFWCHRKIANRELVIKNNSIAEKILVKWGKEHPNSVKVFKQFFPISTEVSDEKGEKD